jgi:hypothetical protein
VNVLRAKHKVALAARILNQRRLFGWGAFNETMRDLMIADVVEPIVFPAVLHTVDGLTNLLAPGLNAPGRNRYIWRGGKRIDLQTGRIID